MPKIDTALEEAVKLLPVPDPGDVNDFVDLTVNAMAHTVRVCANVWDRALSGDLLQKIGWEFYRAMVKPNNKFGLRVQDFDHLLNPNCADEFTTIPPFVWDRIKDHAENLLMGGTDSLREGVVEHLEAIADGKVPFGLEVK